MPENVFPTPTPPLPSRFRFLIAVPGPSKGLSCHLAGAGAASQAAPRTRPGRGLRGKKLWSVYKLAQRWDTAIHMPPPGSGAGSGAALPWQSL